MSVKLIVSLLVSVVVVACAITVDAERAPWGMQATAGDWTIELTLSGGIAGMMRRVTVTSKGEAQVRDLRRDKQVHTRLSPERAAEFGALSKHIGDADSERPAFMSRCADCVNYELTVFDGDVTRQRRFDSRDLGNFPYRDLVTALIDLMNTALR